MSQPFVGEIRLFGGNFAPAGWMFCDGALLAIAENDTLFNLIGTTYGGDGQSTFALPDLRGRVPIHQGARQGTTFTLAESGGVENVTLATAQVPAHTHSLLASSSGATVAPAAGNVLAQTPSYTPYITAPPNTPLSPLAISATGGSQPHSNIQPYLCVNYIISLFGIYPSQS